MNNDCIFCSKILPEQILTESKHFFVVFDKGAVQIGHLLIISKAHIMDLRELSDEQLSDLIKLEQRLSSLIEDTFAVDGVSIIQNNGGIMQVGTHCHVHVIPRWKDDQFWDNQVVVRHENDRKILEKRLRNQSHTNS